MNDEPSDLSERFLHRQMRVIKERAFFMDVKLKDLRLSRFNGILSQCGGSGILNGQLESMPVHERIFRQFIGHDDANTVALRDFDRRAGHAAVVAVDVHLHARMKLLLNRHRHKFKHLHAAIHLVGQLRNIGSLKRRGAIGSLAKPWNQLADVIVRVWIETATGFEARESVVVRVGSGGVGSGCWAVALPPSKLVKNPAAAPIEPAFKNFRRCSVFDMFKFSQQIDCFSIGDGFKATRLLSPNSPSFSPRLRNRVDVTWWRWTRGCHQAAVQQVASDENFVRADLFEMLDSG